MNIRIRQKMKADHMLDKYDPIIIASVVQKDTPFRQCLIFRRSEYGPVMTRLAISSIEMNVSKKEVMDLLKAWSRTLSL